jgi:hypothetical protein
LFDARVEKGLRRGVGWLLRSALTAPAKISYLVSICATALARLSHSL